MKSIQMILSILLIAGIPSIAIYTFMDVYLNINPFYINLVNGIITFIIGGAVVASANSKDTTDGSS